jgi:hypothetical protein
MNHELRTFKEELHFFCTIFSPKSKTPTGAHQNYTGFSWYLGALVAKTHTQHHFCTILFFSTVYCMLSTVDFFKTAPKFHQTKKFRPGPLNALSLLLNGGQKLNHF